MSKCEILRFNIDYLGYEISAGGVEKKIQSVLNFPRPGNVHSVRQFLGACASYFRKFIQNFAQIASSLTQLLKKDIAWQWGHSVVEIETRREANFNYL